MIRPAAAGSCADADDDRAAAVVERAHGALDGDGLADELQRVSTPPSVVISPSASSGW